MTELLIRNAEHILTMDDARRELLGADVLIRDGEIAAIGQDLATTGEILDAAGCVVTPGLVNTHHHLYQTLTRAVPGGQNALLFGWLKTLYPIWAKFTPDHMFVSAQVGLAELALSGCTLSSDHLYLYPNGTKIDDTIYAAAEIGLRFQPTRGAMSIGESNGGLPPDRLVENEAAILEDCIRVIDRFNAYSLETFGCRPGQYVQDLEWVGSDVWLAHCVKLDQSEIDLFAATRTGVAHCPCSNCRLGSGIAPIRAMRDRGVPVGLGVDGSASNDAGNLMAEARQAMLLQRVANGADAMSAREALEIATRGGADILGRPECGRIAVGARADIAIWDVRGIESAGSWDPAALLLAGPTTVRDLVVEGRRVVRGGQICTIDLPALIAKQNKLAHALRDCL